MKEFKLRFTADVADIEAQFKGAASELKKFAAGVASAENQLEALQQTGAYLTQMDKQLSELKKKHPDIFKQIFGNVDAQMKAALEPLARSSTEVGKLVKEIGDKLSGIASGKVEATNTEMKKLGETVATLAKTMEMQADLDFLNGTDKARLKAQKLIDVLSNLAVAYYKLDKASDQTDLGSLVTKGSEQETPKKTKGGRGKKTTETSAQPKDVITPELEQLQMEVDSLHNQLEFERNRYERILASKDAGIARHLREKIKLDLDSMRETAKYLDPDDAMRITRRLDRIDKVLSNMGQKGSNSAPVVDNLKNINNELENQIDELEQQKIRYQEIIDILSGENPDIKLKTTKKTDEQQLKDLVQQFNEATEAVLKFEAANNTSGDAYKKALGEQYRLATLVKNTMDYVSEKGSAKGADYVLSQVGSGGVYDQAEKIIDGLKTSVASSIQKALQEAIDKINSEASAKLQSDNSSGTEVKAAQEAADAAKLKADENERSRLAAEAEAKAAQDAVEAARQRVEAEAKAEETKIKFFELTKSLDSDLSTGNFDEFSLGKSQAELDKAQQELKELADAGHIAADVMEEVDAAYKKTSSAISTSYEGMRNENMLKEDAGSYDQGYFDAEKRFEQDRISYLHENNELQKKVESLEQKLAQSQTQSTSEIGTDSSSEIVKYEKLKQNLNDIITLINAKTDAFTKAGTTVDSVISSEIISLDKLVEKLREVLNNIQNINNTSIDINTENVKNEIDTLFSKLTDSSYDTEYLGLLNSKTGKLSSEYFEGAGNRAEGTFKNKADYDTMFHNHPGVSAAVASFGDWKAFLSEFDNFKRQIILTKDEIKTFDLSGLTKEELKKIVDAIKREIADAKKYDAEWVQDTEKYGKDEATQRWTQRRTESILANYPNVKISTKPVIENIAESNISNTDSEIIQSEINFLSSLENKILDVKRAIEEKNKAFVNEGNIVDTVTMQEVSSLDKLLTKINEIKLAVDSKTQSIVNGANTIAANVNDIKTTQPVTNSTKAKTQSISSGIPDIDIERQIALIIKQEAQWKSTGQLTDELHQKIEKLSSDLLNLTNSSDLVVWRKQWMILKDEVTAAKYEIEATKKAQSQSEASSQQYWDSAFKESLSGLITPEKRPELEQLKVYMLQQADQTKEAIAERYGAIMTIISNKNATMQKLMSAKGENERSYWQNQYSAWFGAWEALDEKEIEAFFKDAGNAAVIGSDGIEKFNAQLELSKQLSGKQQDKQLTELNKLYEKQAQSVANQDKYNAQLQSSSVGNAQKDTIREKLKIEQEIEKELQKQIESYGSLYKESDRLTVIEEKRKEAAIEIQENANKEIDRENKRLSNYGKATYTSATKKYENISDVVNNSDFVSDSLLSAMDAYKKKYDELTAARQRFIDNPALAKEESEQNAFRKIAIETDKAREKVSLYIEDIKKYNEVINNGALKDEIPIGNYDGVKSQTDAIKEYAEKIFEGKLQITGWNAAGNEMYGTLDKGKGVIENVTVALNRGTNELYAYGRGTKEAGTAWKQFTGGIAKKSKEILTYLAGGQSIYQFISEIRKGVQYVKEIDSALTELKKVTDETDQAYAQFLQTMSQTGSEIGATVSDLTNMAASWARLGYSMKEAGELARSTAVLLNVSEFTDADSASEALISTMQAYGYAAEDSMHVVDVLNEIGNNFAISSDGIATALQDSASSLMAAGNNLEQSVAMIAAANKVLQDPNSVGSALRTISLRIRGTSVKVLEEMGEETDGVIESVSKLQSKIKGLTGVNILNDAGGYKDTYTIIKEIAEVWPELSDINKAATLELLAGKNRSNAMAAMLTNIDDLKNAYQDAMDAEGSAMAENEKYLDSIQGRIDQFTNALQTMWMNAISSDLIKSIVNVGTILIKVLDTLGFFPTVLASIAAVNVFKIFLPDIAKYIKYLKALISLSAQQGESMESIARQTSIASDSMTISFKKLGGTLKSIVKFFKANPYIFAAMAAVTAVTAVIAVNKKLKQAEEEAAQAALESGNSIKESNKSLDEYKEKILELRSSLEKGNLSEAEAYESRKQLISIQDELISKYGQEAEGINLVTGSIENQIDALDKLAVANANDWLNKNSQQSKWLIFKGDSPIDQAIEAIEGTQDTYLNLGTLIFDKVFKKAYNADEWKNEWEKAAVEYKKFVESLGGTLDLDSNTIIFKDVTKEQIEENYDKITNWLREYAAKTGNKINFNDMIGKISANKEELLGDNFETQKANYDAYLENTAIASYTDAYGAILDEKEKFQKAYASGDKEAIQETRASLETAITKAQEEAGNDTRMVNWFGGLDDAFESAFKDIDFDNAWENTGNSLKSSIEDALKNIGADTDIDILNIGNFIDENGKLKDGVDGITQEQVNAYNTLKSKAEEYGFSIDEIVAKLAKIGLIKSNLTEDTQAVEAVGNSFANYASTIEQFTEAKSIANELIYDNIELTEEQGEALSSLIGSETEYAEAVDTSNGYIVKNAKLVKDLIARKKAEASQNVKIEKTQARLKYYDLYKQIKKLSGASGELAAKNKDQINTLYAEMGIVQQTISKYSMLEQKLLGAADAYDEFEEAQTADSESDYSTKMTDMLTGLVNGLQTGKIGTEAFKAAVRGLVPDEELDKLDSVKDKVKAIADYVTTSNFKDYFNFEFEDDGTLKDITMNMDNVEAFVKDGFKNGALIQTGEDWTQFELSDQINTLDDLAKAYGITREAAFAFLQLLNQYDGEWLNGDFATTFDSLIPTAATIKEAGKQMQEAFDQANVDLTVRPKVSWEKMNEAGWNTEEGSYSTVNTVTYLASDFGLAKEGSEEDYAINVTPILPDGTVIKGGEDGLWEYINGKKNNGENIEDLDIFLGKYDSLAEAEEAAQVLHEAQEAYYGMVSNYSIDNDISETTRKITELNVQLANGEITQDKYMARMYGIGDAATETEKATGGLKGNLETLGETARENIKEWEKASDGYNEAKEKVAELEEEIKNASADELPRLQEELKRATGRMANFAQEMSAHEYTELTVEFAIDEIEQKYTNFADSVEFDNESGKFVIKSGINLPADQLDEFDYYLDLLNKKHTLEVGQGQDMPTTLDVLSEISTTLQTIADVLTGVTAKQWVISVGASISQGVKDFWDWVTGNSGDVTVDIPKSGAIVKPRNTSNSRQNIQLEGTANATGDWGLSQSEHNSLVGELGQELVVNPQTGKYYTVGDNGAELVDLPKNAIIFNHKQTEELFKNGHINSRGKAYAQGNAHLTYDTSFTTKTNYSGAGSYWTDFAKNIGATIDDASSDASDNFEELFDWFEVLINEIDQSINLITAKIENTVGASNKNALYQQVVELNYAKMAALNNGIELYSNKAQEFLNEIPQAYKEMAKNGAVALTDFQGEVNEKVLEAIKNYREWKDKAADLNVELENTKKNIADINVQMLEAISTEYENKIGLITNLNDRIQKAMDLQEESGERLSANYYNEMIKNAQEALSLQRQQRKEMQAQLDQSVASGDIERYSEDWYEMVNAINSVDEAIVQSEIDIESFQNAINDLHWENFERLIKNIENVSDEAEHLRNLIKDDDLTDDVGNWTEAGITALGLVSQEMENAKYRAELYGKEIEQLKKDYKAGLYSQDEYNDKLQELKSSQWDCIDAYESAKDAIVDLNKTRIEAVKDGIQKEIDAYEKLINKRKEDLDAQKD